MSYLHCYRNILLRCGVAISICKRGRAVGRICAVNIERVFFQKMVAEKDSQEIEFVYRLKHPRLLPVWIPEEVRIH